jgi:hypothetical protein
MNSYMLNVQGDVNFSGTIYQNNTPFSGGGGSSQWTTSGTNIYILSSNVGIGTATPIKALDVYGDIQTSNLRVLGMITYGSNDTINTNIQVPPVRSVTYVQDPSQSTFVLTKDGFYGGTYSNVNISVGQGLLSYYNSSITDYSLVVSYNATQTIYTVGLTTPADYASIVDITIWPTIIPSSPSQGNLIQTVTVSSIWTQQNSIIYYNGNVGIGTTNPSTALYVNGIVTASTFSGIGQGFSSMEVKTSGTSWTVPANVYKIKVTVVGGGGGGGGCQGTNANGNGSAGAGGGSGGVCIGFCNVTPGQTLTYAIGAAGAASTASGTSDGGNGGNSTITIGLLTFTANGGGGGLGGNNGYAGGTGGTATGGTLNLSGQDGGNGGLANSGSPHLVFPIGGNTPLSLGQSAFANRSVTASPSTGYGAGGTAGCVIGGAGTAKAGAAGTTGALIIEY